MIWLDDRRRPSPYALAFLGGLLHREVQGDTLEITTTHLKESYRSPQRRPTQFPRDGHRTRVAGRAVPGVDVHGHRSGLSDGAPGAQRDVCPRADAAAAAVSVSARRESARCRSTGCRTTCPARIRISPNRRFKYKAPLEGVRGGAETLYPEWCATRRDAVAAGRAVHDQARLQRRVDAHR